MDATLEAVKRTGKGKNEARRLRASGKVPAVVYGAQKAGDKVAPVPVAVSPKEMMRILHSASGVNTLITLTVPGESTQRVLVKEFQLDPVTQHLLHADFYRVNLERKITVTVPLVGRSIPAIRLSSVVLPEPDGPMRATKSPSGTCRLRPSSTTMSCASRL